ncbi:MAG: efflux RND transporter periplasmic adaptor subunit [Gemmatimonadetes bacterium]|nr:efflux RND transporter periplasmic adaptor subunit [Gemmatimonadota bacterium]
MTSALEARPKLRTDLKIVRREHEGRVHYVVKEPQEQKYYQFGELEIDLMRLMDGRRTPAEIAELAEETLRVRLTAGHIADFAHKLKRRGLVERSPAEQHLILMERLRAQRKVRVRRRTRGSILRLRFSVGDPDRLFERMVQRLHWMWSPGFVGASIVLFAAYFLILGLQWEEFFAGTMALYTLQGVAWTDYVLIWALEMPITVVHELGHGLTTKRFGGEVRDVGGMLLYFSFALYCNTNDAWTFQKRSHRLWVNFAGPWIELVIAAVGAVVWVLAEPGTFVHRVAFLSILVGGIGAVMANLNPLIPLDGYYALSDWLEIPNLRGRSFEYWGWLTKRYVLGIDAAEPAVTPRERKAFLLYGGLASAYSAAVIVISVIFLILVFGRFVGGWVWIAVALMMVPLVRRVRGRWSAIAVAARTTWRAALKRSGKRSRMALAGTALGIVVLLVLPWTFRARGEFRVEAAPRAYVRAEVLGVLDRLHVRDGDTVRAGAPLTTLWNPQLESEFLAQEALTEQWRITLAQAEAQNDRAAAASAATMLREGLEKLAVLRAQRERLVVRAPIDGVVLAYRPWERLGEGLEPGDLLFEIASLQGRVARVRVPPSVAADVAPGQRASLKFAANPRLKFRATVAAVSPAAEEGWLEAVIPLPAADWQPAPGMTGVAKIETGRATVAKAIARAVRQTIRMDLLL